MSAQIIRFMPKKRSIKEVIEGLAKREERFLKADGSVNANQFAAAIGVAQASVSRALERGEKYIIRRRMTDGLVDYFGITPAQSRGEEGFRERARLTPALSHDARWIAEQLDPQSHVRRDPCDPADGASHDGCAQKKNFDTDP